MKRLVSLILSLTFILALAPSAFATSEEAINAANALYELGLFSGTGTDANGNPNFDLDRAPTRHEAVTMLVRLLGKASEAESGTWNTPFTDVADWAKPYVGYAYTNGLTSGTSATTYGGNQIVTASQYLTFVLRALGYESGTDFQWDKAWELSDKIGMTDGRYNTNTVNFTRGDVAIISNSALSTKSKNSEQTLLDSLNRTTNNGTIISSTITANDLQGVWYEEGTYTDGSKYGGEYVISGSNFTYAQYYIGTDNENYLYYVGSFQIENGNMVVSYQYKQYNFGSLSSGSRESSICKLTRLSENRIKFSLYEYERTPMSTITNQVISALAEKENSTTTITVPGGNLNAPVISANSRWTYDYRLPNGNLSGSRYVMDVKWTSVSDADGYILYVKQGDWGTWEKYYKTYDSSTTGDTFDYWRSGIVYSFKVVAYKGSGTNIVYSNESNVVSEMWYSPKSN